MVHTKRLFFGLDILSPWANTFPEGRILKEKNRHLTLLFLGEIMTSPLLNELSNIPKPGFQIGLVGFFDKSLFLPTKRPHVVSWHVDWLGQEHSLLYYRNELISWLKKLNITVKNEERDFLSHVTLSRAPFNKNEWESFFYKQPLYFNHVHLYESLGHSDYKSLFSIPLRLPFEELEHTADIAFLIRGKNLHQLFINAQIALSFKFIPLLNVVRSDVKVQTIDDVIIALNAIVAEADRESDQLCPFKAVCFHGDIEIESDQTLRWEMIVDV